MPFAGQPVFHPRWSEHHRPVTTSAQTGTCRITRTTGSGSLGAGNVWHPPTPVIVYTGTCRVAPPGSVSNPLVGEKRLGITDYKVMIPWDAPEILERDDVEVLTAEDPQLPGRHLQVTGTAGGGGTQQWERVLTCTQDITNREA